MQAIINFRLDEMIKEGIEYLPQFWEVKLGYLRMIELEFEFERSMLAREMSEFHRRCVDNDRPGKRHMLPFYWKNTLGVEGIPTKMQVPIRVGTPMYDHRMAEYKAEYKAKMDTLKRRTPNYGR